MIINGFEGVSLLDYPGKICSIVYTSPCNFKCPFCHNPSLVTENADVLSEEFVLSDILDRRNFIDAVTVTGGEPTLQAGLPSFLGKIKDMGLSTKLDTNGYRPDMLESLFRDGLVDYAAMDIKAPLHSYSAAAGLKVDTKKIEKSVGLIMEHAPDYAFRTTAVPGITGPEAFESISEMIEGAKLYVIQQFENELTLDESMKRTAPFTEKELETFAGIAAARVKKVRLANIRTPA